MLNEGEYVRVRVILNESNVNDSIPRNSLEDNLKAFLQEDTRERLSKSGIAASASDEVGEPILRVFVSTERRTVDLVFKRFAPPDADVDEYLWDYRTEVTRDDAQSYRDALGVVLSKLIEQIRADRVAHRHSNSKDSAVT